MPTNRPDRTDEPAALSLREFWEKLQRERTGGAAAPPASGPAAPAPSAPAILPSAGTDRPAPVAVPAFDGVPGGVPGSGGTSEAGSGGGGYGLGLIVPDRFSRERILGIMKTLCEKDAAKKKP